MAGVQLEEADAVFASGPDLPVGVDGAVAERRDDHVVVCERTRERVERRLVAQLRERPVRLLTRAVGVEPGRGRLGSGQ